MNTPLRLPDHHPVQRWLAACAIGLLAAGLGIALWAPAAILNPVRTLDDVLYDSLYRLRPARDVRNGPIVIVAVDEVSMRQLKAAKLGGWPWPRKYWGQIVSHLEAAGAKAVVFDLLFDEPSVRNTKDTDDDDRAFAEAIDASAKPTVLAQRVRPERPAWELAPPVSPERRILGAANAPDQAVIRAYVPVVHGVDSLALAAAKQAGITPPDWARGTAPFLLRYYGPHARGDTPATFRYVRAGNVLAAAEAPADSTATFDIAPGTFKDKVVFVATITAATYDRKTSPLSDLYPGVEVHATALQNMIDAQRVTPVGAALRVLALGLGCFAAAIGTTIPARVPFKVVGGLAGPAAVLGLTAALFLADDDVRWHPPAAAMLAATLAAFGGLAWSYLTEVRQRRLIARAFAQYVSREVVEAMLKDPRKIALTGDRRDMSVMFTDIANFTTVSEKLDVENVARMLNFYLEEMSGVILNENGTLDKYIGDSIMCFWNAPTDQADHARRACRAALGMRAREQAVAEQLKLLAGDVIYSRAGINSGPMSVGNMGSSAKFNYTVLGDSVNLASRLEGANKMYGTRTLLSDNTAKLVQDQFVVRKVDLIRVKGRSKPMAIYELMAEGNADPATAALVERYERALALYQSGQLDTAYDLLQSVAEDFPADGPTATLLGRIEQFRANPPPADWDGVYVAKDK